MLNLLANPAARKTALVNLVLILAFVYGETRWHHGHSACESEYLKQDLAQISTLSKDLQQTLKVFDEEQNEAREFVERLERIARTDRTDEILAAVQNTRCADLGADFIRLWNEAANAKSNSPTDSP